MNITLNNHDASKKILCLSCFLKVFLYNILQQININSWNIHQKLVEKFSALADEWWDPEGSFQPLHKLNPARLGYIRDRICDHFGRSTQEPKPLMDLRLADVGCGGGLLTEPMARLGANVTGLDA